MRHRRAQRCLLRAEIALDAGFADDAREALEEARRLGASVEEVARVDALIAASSLSTPLTADDLPLNLATSPLADNPLADTPLAPTSPIADEIHTPASSAPDAAHEPQRLSWKYVAAAIVIMALAAALAGVVVLRPPINLSYNVATAFAPTPRAPAKQEPQPSAAAPLHSLAMQNLPDASTDGRVLGTTGANVTEPEVAEVADAAAPADTAPTRDPEPTGPIVVQRKTVDAPAAAVVSSEPPASPISPETPPLAPSTATQTSASRSAPETTAARSITETTARRSVTETSAPRSVLETSASRSATETIAPRSSTETVAPRSATDTTAPRSVPETSASRSATETIAPRSATVNVPAVVKPNVDPVPDLVSPPTPAPLASTPISALATVPVRDESADVRAVLARYESAYSKLDPSQARAVWPRVDERALSRAFSGLASQRVSLGRCDVTLNGATARATCAGSATWTPKVGGGGARTEARRWTFDLTKSGDGWKIEKALVK